MKKLIAILGIFSVISLPAKSNPLWQDIVVNTNLRGISQEHFRPLSADIIQLKQLLETAPLQNSGIDGTVIDLPLPDGKFVQVEVFNSPILSPHIAKSHPDIKTFKAFGIGKNYISGRLDFTPKGFHAMLNTSEGIVYINPEANYSSNSLPNAYRSFKKSTQTTPNRFNCQTTGQKLSLLKNSNNITQKSNRPSAAKDFGSNLRTYRLALAATREYSMAVADGNLNNTLAEMVTAVNRINEVYEKDVAITLQLVSGTELISTKKTDFSNTDGSAMLTENQFWIDNKIGPDNYDIGHIFSTGGGGVASIAAVCDDDVDGKGADIAFKAQGVTGSDSPTTDAFYIDYVAHEIGHQFGASHTFNATGINAGFCDGNRAPNIESNSKYLVASAFEVGSGSTIMSYAGICDTQDLQNNSDAYFHSRSIEQIREFVDGDIASTYEWADGSICGTSTNTGDMPPVANAGINYTIPRATPFVLTGSGIDSDSNFSTFNYTWEQYDLGLATTSLNGMHVDKGTGPILRSQPGSVNPERYFPSLNAILSGNLESITGERLPTTERSMKFRLTLRTGTYGVAQDDTTITVDKDSGPFIVTAPDNTTPLSGFQNIDVTWNVANTTASPVNCATVDILFSNDGGMTFTSNFISNTPNDGNAQVILPNINTTEGRIKVACSNNIFFNINTGNLTINAVDNSVSISDTPALNEGDSGTTDFMFSVSLNQPASTTITVDYKTTGVASNGADANDFGSNFPIGTVTFLTGEQTKTISIPVSGDTLAETDEIFQVTLLNATNSGIGNSSSAGTIINDDNNTTFNISSVTAGKKEGNSGSTTFNFIISRIGLNTISSSITYTVTGTGTNPTNSDDFPNGSLIPVTITFLPGETSKTITINANGDTQIENDEAFSVNLSDPVNAEINQAAAVSSINDDDKVFINTKKNKGGGQTNYFILLGLLALLIIKRSNTKNRISTD